MYNIYSTENLVIEVEILAKKLDCKKIRQPF